jgi:hypothetical protein
VVVGRRDVDVAGDDLLVVQRVLRRQRPAGGQELGQRAHVARRHVDHDEHRCGEILRQRAHQLEQHLDAARRGADGDDVVVHTERVPLFRGNGETRAS